MDLGDDKAQEVLNSSVKASGKKQQYGFNNGKVYEFQPDNVGGYHGYPMIKDKAPTAALKELKNKGVIGNSRRYVLK